MELIFASNNLDKLREVKKIMEPAGFTVLSQREAGIELEADETGTTFSENSAIKAKALYELVKKSVIADDSGIEVDYLNKEPGVYSARYGGEGVDDVGRCELILSRLEGVEDSLRTARFVAVITYIDENGKMMQFEGRIEGRIGYKRIGDRGFGYDPIFMVGQRSLAEFTDSEKNAVSHRGEALRKLEKYLEGEC